MHIEDESKIIDTPLVAIVILVWNNHEDSRKCIESCYTLTYKNLRLILVDNGSSDGSGHRLYKEFSDLDFIYNHENLGYAGGNNIGIRRALELGAEFVLILNNDIEIESKDLIEKMVFCFKKIPLLGILGPRINLLYHADDYSMLGYRSRLYDFVKKHFLPNTYFDVPDDLGLSVRESVVVSGSAIMVSRELLDKVGYFNEEFFMYGEEDDLCLRASKSGFFVACVDDRGVSILRKGYTSYDDLVPWKAFIMSRNRFIQLRSFSFYEQTIIIILHIISLAHTTIKRVFMGRWKNIYYSFWGFFYGLTIWAKDLLGLSNTGDYLVSGRKVAMWGLFSMPSINKSKANFFAFKGFKPK